MILQGPKLSFRMQGDDVALLHRELQYLGLDIAESEIKGHFFGESTLDQVKRFQTERGLAITGEVGKRDGGAKKASSSRAIHEMVSHGG